MTKEYQTKIGTKETPLSPLSFILPIDKEDIRRKISEGIIVPPDDAEEGDLYVMLFDRFHNLINISRIFREVDFYRIIPLNAPANTAVSLLKIENGQFVVISHLWIKEAGEVQGMKGKQVLVEYIVSENDNRDFSPFTMEDDNDEDISYEEEDEDEIEEEYDEFDNEFEEDEDAPVDYRLLSAMPPHIRKQFLDDLKKPDESDEDNE